MLSENDVIRAVCRHLKSNGYRILSKAATNQHGKDVVAERVSDGRTLLIEAKGETSALESSARFGKAFDRKQCRTHIGIAFFTVARLAEASTNMSSTRVAIALPDTVDHRDLAATIRLALRQLGIGLFLGAPNGKFSFPVHGVYESYTFAAA